MTQGQGPRTLRRHSSGVTSFHDSHPDQTISTGPTVHGMSGPASELVAIVAYDDGSLLASARLVIMR